jgi:hypothetical protein
MWRQTKTACLALGLSILPLSVVLAQAVYTPGALPPGCGAAILATLQTAPKFATGITFDQIMGGSIGNITTGSGNGVISNTNPSGVSVSGSGTSLTYTAADGTQYTQTGGTPAWRNNNPGNLVYNSYTASLGAIGQNGNFAVFPDVATGQAALTSLLTGSTYQNLTVDQAIARYAPAFQNQTANYQTFVTTQLGASGSTSMSSLSPTQISTMAGAIQQQEGYVAGITTKL